MAAKEGTGHLHREVGSGTDLKEAFVRLQPLCSQLSASLNEIDAAPLTSSAPTRIGNLVERLHSIVPELPPFGLQRCLDYLLLPLLALLTRHQALGQVQMEAALHVIEAAVQRCGPVLEMAGELGFTSPRFQQLFHTFIEVLSPSPLPPVAASASSSSSNQRAPHEDLKLCAVRCLGALLRPWSAATGPATGAGGRPPFIGSASSLALSAYGVSLLIDEATTATNRDLRVAALEALFYLCSRLSSYKSGEAVAFVLPGVVSALGKVMLGDFKQGHQVFEAAIDLCGEVVCSVMNDETNRSLIPEPTAQVFPDSTGPSVHQVTSLLSSLADSAKKDPQHTSKGKEKAGTGCTQTASPKPAEPFTVTRDEEWLKKTVANLRGLFSDVFQASKLMMQHHWSLAHCAGRLLLECKMTLETCTSMLMTTLIFLARDDVADVSRTATAAIKAICESQGEWIYTFLSENLQDGLLSSLSRNLRDPDESAKLAAVRLLFNHMYLLKAKLQPIFSSSSFLARFSIALLHALEFDAYDVQTHAGSGFQRQLVYLEQASDEDHGEDNDFKDLNLYPRRTFRYLRSEAVENLVKLVCLYLGRYGDLHLLLDHFLQIAHDPRNIPFRSQAFFTINHLLLGAAGVGLPSEDAPPTDKPDIFQEVEFVLEGYLDESFWKLPTANMRSVTAIHSSNVLNENAISLSLLLEGLGSCAQIMGRKFDDHLMATLHSLLEKLGDTNGLVSRSAYATLRRVCFHCGYKSLPHLIAKNTDYLIDSISLRMKHLDLYPNTPQVLHAILEYGILRATGEKDTNVPLLDKGPEIDDIVWLLDDTIQSVFNRLDGHNAEYTLTFFRILESIVGVLVRKYEREGWIMEARQPDAHLLLMNEKSRGDEEEHHKVRSATDSGGSPEDSTRNQDDHTPADSSKGSTERMEEIERYFMEHHTRKQNQKEAEEHEAEAEDSKGQQAPMSKSREKERDTVAKILERCQHFVSVRQLEVRLSVLEVVARCVRLLSPDRRRLLPAVHLIWRPLATRFADRDRVQAIKSWEVASVIGAHAGDFVFHRVKEDLWPAMRDRVIPSDHALLKQEMRSWSSFSAANSLAYRSQLALLHCLSSLCTSVFARVTHFESSSSAQELATGIFGATYIYFDETMPTGLRDGAAELVKLLALLSPRVRTQLQCMADASEGFYTAYLPYPFPSPAGTTSTYVTVIGTDTQNRRRGTPTDEVIAPRVRALDIRQGVTAILDWLKEKSITTSIAV